MVVTGSTRNRFVSLRAGHVGSNPTLSATKCSPDVSGQLAYSVGLFGIIKYSEIFLFLKRKNNAICHKRKVKSEKYFAFAKSWRDVRAG